MELSHKTISQGLEHFSKKWTEKHKLEIVLWSAPLSHADITEKWPLCKKIPYN